MKVTAEASAVKKALDILRPGGTARRATAAERGVKIEARGKGVLEATTTDMAHWESVRILGQQVEGTGSVLLPWSQLRKVLSIMKQDEITFTQDGDDVIITSGETSMRMATLVGRNGRGKHVLGEFPSAPARPRDAIKVPLHLGALAECAKFTSPDEYHPALGCVYYDAGTYVATDSYRLALVEVPEGALDMQFLIPGTAYRAMSRLGTEKFIDAWVHQPSNQCAMLWMDFGDASLTAKLGEGQFPDYRRLIDNADRGGGLKATQQMRDAALRIYRLIRACGSDSYWLNSPVKIEQVGDSVVLAAKVGNNTIEIKAMGSVDVSAAFNPKYLAEFFEGTNVDTIFGADSIKPWGLEEPADYCLGAKRTRLLMPTRIYNDW